MIRKNCIQALNERFLSPLCEGSSNIAKEEAERMQELEDERKFCEMLVFGYEMAKPSGD